MYFQFMIEDILSALSLDLKCEPYLDDLTCHGTSIPEVWASTLGVIKAITDAGIMINMKKCKLLVRRF